MISHGTGKTENHKAELVVIGGGGAGLAAAVAAAEKGATNIIVLEKRNAPGGNTAMAMGPFAADSPAQKRMAIEFNRDVFFKIAMDWAHWKTNPRIVRAFIDKSGDTIRWLEDKGIIFECMPLYVNQTPLVWHVPKGRCAEIMKVLADECKRLGVEVLTRTPAKKLLTDKKGNVTGVLAERKGKEVTITAKSVIIATGGFGGNKELLKKYCPQYRDNMECDGLLLTGDGLIMAMEIGAATEGLGLLMMSAPQLPRSVMMKIGTPPDIMNISLMHVALEPNTVWVNKKGVRFVDEGASNNHFECSNAVNRQPGNVCYVLLDQKLVQTMTENGLIIGLGRYCVEERTKMPGLERGIQGQADKGSVKISDSWDGIADWIGADPKVLKSTIDEYNTACDHGYDQIFAKERVYLAPLRTSPYYAIKAKADFLDTLGGIKINEHMEVLDKQDNPIQGLYAAGVTTGGWEADTYCALLSGAASGYAFNSGRIAGENAVKFAQEARQR